MASEKPGISLGGDATIYGPVAGRDVYFYGGPATRPHLGLPNQPYFFGREDELKRIAESLDPAANGWGVLIDGPAGIGKSSLAIRAGHQAPEAQYETKLFLTAKTQHLAPHGRVSLQDFALTTFEALVTELGQAVGHDEITKLEPSSRAVAVTRALAKSRLLAIIDNVESLSRTDLDRLFQFLKFLPRTCRAIVTSRLSHVGAEIIRLSRLSPEAAEGLIDEKTRNNPLLARAGAEERRLLYQTSGGNPLLIEWLAGQIGRPGSRCRSIPEACEFLRRAPSENDPLEYMFGDLTESLNPIEVSALACLVHFRTPVTPPTLCELLEHNVAALEGVLIDLTERGLVEGDLDQRRFVLAPLVAEFLRRRQQDVVGTAGQRILDEALRLVEARSGSRSERFRLLGRAWPLIEAAIPLALDGDYQRLTRFCNSTIVYLDWAGHWDERLQLALEGERKAQIAGDWKAAGWRAYQAAQVYQKRGQAADVIAAARRAEAHWEKEGPEQRASALLLRGWGHQLAKDMGRAADCFQQAADLWRVKPDSNLPVALLSLGEARLAQGEAKRAEQCCQEALDVSRSLDYGAGEAAALTRLADLAVRSESWAVAEERATQALARDEGVEHQSLIAQAHLVLARSLARRQRRADALPHARLAEQIFTRLRSRDAADARALVRECEPSPGA